MPNVRSGSWHTSFVIALIGKARADAVSPEDTGKGDNWFGRKSVGKKRTAKKVAKKKKNLCNPKKVKE